MTQLPWYHRTTIYQIYPRSFYDSNGDGIGDLQGIIQKLDYIHDLGFESIWISPFFASPQADFGYDISNYTDVAPEYGTMQDALQLIEEVHKRGMKIILDMVMNHTSIDHAWFKESRSSRDNPKADWYIWRDKPNNWLSLTGGSGWHYAQERDQYYWASFLPVQPDLNYRNPEVKKTMFDTVRFWLGKGVDGFRLDMFNAIYKDAGLRNNPFSFKLIPSESDPSGFFQEARYIVNLPEDFTFAKEFRNVCDEFGERLSLGEVSGNREIIRKFLGDQTNDGLTLVFDFGMLNFKFTADYFHTLIQNIETHYPDPFMPVYVFSNHDRARSIEHLDKDARKAKLLAMLQLTVRGAPCMYYGEELGMANLQQPFKTALDPIPHKFTFLPRFVFDALGLLLNRDEVRTPMQWDATRNAGFSSAEKTWLPVHPNFVNVNVEKEINDTNSLIDTIRALLKIRKGNPALAEGSLELIEELPDSVLGYIRRTNENEVTVLMNFSNEEKIVAFSDRNWRGIFNLSNKNKIKEKAIRLNGLDGMILNIKV